MKSISETNHPIIKNPKFKVILNPKSVKIKKSVDTTSLLLESSTTSNDIFNMKKEKFHINDTDIIENKLNDDDYLSNSFYYDNNNMICKSKYDYSNSNFDNLSLSSLNCHQFFNEQFNNNFTNSINNDVYLSSQINKEENSNSNNSNNSNNNSNVKFIITNNNTNTDLIKKKKRKYKPDSIRKKIKSRFLKKLKELLNNKLKEIKCKLYFDYLPQSFINNISIEVNKKILDYTIGDLYKENFGGNNNDNKKLFHNINTLKYINKHSHCKKYKYILYFLNLTFKDVFENYIHSDAFIDELYKLKNQGEDELYISKYKYYGTNWVKFYNSGNININK